MCKFLVAKNVDLNILCGEKITSRMYEFYNSPLMLLFLVLSSQPQCLQLAVHYSNQLPTAGSTGGHIILQSVAQGSIGGHNMLRLPPMPF